MYEDCFFCNRLKQKLALGKMVITVDENEAFYHEYGSLSVSYTSRLFVYSILANIKCRFYCVFR